MWTVLAPSSFSQILIRSCPAEGCMTGLDGRKRNLLLVRGCRGTLPILLSIYLSCWTGTQNTPVIISTIFGRLLLLLWLLILLVLRLQRLLLNCSIMIMFCESVGLVWLIIVCCMSCREESDLTFTCLVVVSVTYLAQFAVHDIAYVSLVLFYLHKVAD